MLTAERQAQAERLLEQLKDPQYRKQFFGVFMGHQDWRTVWDKLNAGALRMMSETFPGEFTLEQLGYLANRHAAGVSRSYRPPIVKPRPQNPKTIYVYVIYWLVREHQPDVPLYVGMTRQLSERWTAHRNGSSETKDIDDLASVRITVVETVCGNEKDARAAERKHIAAALKINTKLVNKASV